MQKQTSPFESFLLWLEALKTIARFKKHFVGFKSEKIYLVFLKSFHGTHSFENIFFLNLTLLTNVENEVKRTKFFLDVEGTVMLVCKLFNLFLFGFKV